MSLRQKHVVNSLMKLAPDLSTYFISTEHRSTDDQTVYVYVLGRLINAFFFVMKCIKIINDTKFMLVSFDVNLMYTLINVRCTRAENVGILF